MAFGRAYGRFGARARLTRYPSRRASTALTSGRYAAYRSMRGFRKTGFRGRFPSTRRTVAGNRAGTKRLGARTDFPAYVPRTVSLRQEQKFVEYALVALDPIFSHAPLVRFDVSTASEFQLVPLPQRADALNARLSDRILYNSLIIRGSIYGQTLTAANFPSFTNVDLYIIWDNSPTGSVPVIGDVFTQGGGDSIAPRFVGLLQRPDARDRFSLLYRYRYTLTGCAKPGAEPPIYVTNNGDRVTIPIDLNLSINKVTAFANTSSTGLISDVRRGACYMFWVSDASSTANCHPHFHGYVRGLFADL